MFSRNEASATLCTWPPIHVTDDSILNSFPRMKLSSSWLLPQSTSTVLRSLSTGHCEDYDSGQSFSPEPESIPIVQG